MCYTAFRLSQMDDEKGAVDMKDLDRKAFETRLPACLAH